jgi:ribosomal protein S10
MPAPHSRTKKRAQKAIGHIIFQSADFKKLQQFVSQFYIKLSALNGLGRMSTAPLPTETLFVPSRKSPCGDGSGTYREFYKKIYTRVGKVLSAKHMFLLSQNVAPLPGIDVYLKVFQ